MVGRKAWRFIANAMANVPKETIAPVLGSLASSGRCATCIFEACSCQADGQDITCLALQRSLQIDDIENSLLLCFCSVSLKTYIGRADRAGHLLDNLTASSTQIDCLVCCAAIG